MIFYLTFFTTWISSQIELFNRILKLTSTDLVRDEAIVRENKMDEMIRKVFKIFFHNKYKGYFTKVGSQIVFYTPPILLK